MVISVGKNNDYGHPTVEVLNRLTNKIVESNIYRTDEQGTADFTTDGEKLWVDVEGTHQISEPVNRLLPRILRREEFFEIPIRPEYPNNERLLQDSAWQCHNPTVLRRYNQGLST